MKIPRHYEDLKVLHENTMPARAYYIPASVWMDNLTERRGEAGRGEMFKGGRGFFYFRGIHEMNEGFF